jgi:23S rRNA pseudouridine2605 synthase
MERKRNSDRKFSSDKGNKKSFGKSSKGNYTSNRKSDSNKPDDYKSEKKFSKERDFKDKDDFRPRKKFDGDKKYGEKDDFKPRRFEKKEDSFGGEKKFARKKFDDKDDFRPRKKFDGDKKYGEKDDFKPRRFEKKDDSFGGEKKFARKKFDDKDDFRPRKKFDGDKKYGEKDDFKPRRFEKKEDSFGGEKKFARKKFDDKDDFRPRKKFDGEKKYGEKDDFKPRKFSGENKFDRNVKSDSYGSKKKYNPNDDLKDGNYSFSDKKHDKKRFDSEKKKYQKLTKSGDRKSFATPREDDGTVRLNKYLSNAGICSRREADQLIESGVIRVNGKVVTELGTRILSTDKVSYGDQTVKTESLQYLLLNKPKDYITTVDDPNKRKTVMELIRGACKERVYPVGRLDRNTTGLLLFTNDGELTLKLTHPKNDIRKVYHVVTDQNVSKEDMEKLRNGLELEDGFIMPDDVDFVGEGHNKKDIGIEIHSGKNRVVRRMFEHLGYNVVKLDRVMFAGLTKKDLPRGRWRMLTQKEISFLKMGK